MTGDSVDHARAGKKMSILGRLPLTVQVHIDLNDEEKAGAINS
jgi:hypothetical protein